MGDVEVQTVRKMEFRPSKYEAMRTWVWDRIMEGHSWWLKELSYLEQHADRLAEFRKAMKVMYASGTYWVIAVAGWYLLVRVKWRVAAYFGAPQVTDDIVLVAGVGGITVLGIYTFRRRIQRSLRQQLNARGTPVCLKCGYDLRGQVDARCPECGTPFNFRAPPAGS